MNFKKLKIEGSYIIFNKIFKDKRGFFINLFSDKKIKKKIKFSKVKKGYLSYNKKKYTLRGFHYQIGKYSEGKIITCLNGKIFNVVLDLRKHSKTYLKKQQIKLDSNKIQSLFIPKGCANAFLTMEDNTIVHYYVDQDYYPKSAKGIKYDDPVFKVNWPIKPKIISKKDLSWQYIDKKIF